MDQKSGKSLEQVMDDLNNMLTHMQKDQQGGGAKGGGGGEKRFGLSFGGSGSWLQWLLIAAFVLFFAGVSSFYRIETTQQGVVTRLGAFHAIVGEGPHFKLPFGIDTVYKVEVTRIHEEQFGFRKGGSEISEPEARQESLMLTGDLKVAVVEWILQFKINDPRKYLFHAAHVNKNIRDISISVMRRVVGDKLVSDVLTTDRVLIAEQAKRLTQETLEIFDMGIMITNLNLQNVTPPGAVRSAFNEVNIARQEKDQMINQAKGTYNKVIPEARGKAEKLVAEAEAFAIDVVNRARGDAEKFAAVLVAYRKSPEITRKRLYLETMESIFSQVQKFTVVDSNIKGLMPVFAGAQTLGAPATPRPSEAAPEADASNNRREP